MTPFRSLGILLALATLAALAPLPTAAASTCTATVAAPCAFSCLAGAPITVSATGTGVVAGVCSTSAAECAVQSGVCTLTSALPAASSGTGECVFVGEGSGACSAGDHSHGAGGCDSGGVLALGIVPIVNPVSGEAIAYVDDRSYLLGNGLWLYIESNGESGLQRGGRSNVVPDDSEICNDGYSPPDQLVF